jgi:hypothetical protein
MRWLPQIASKAKRAKAPSFWHIPLGWGATTKIQKLSTDDSKKLKLDRQIKAQGTVRKRRERAVTTKATKPSQTNLFDVLENTDHAEKV